jgi:transposase
LIVPKAFPIEFRRDVVAVARKGEASLAQIAKDFGISESCLQRWLKLADIEEGARPSVTASESAELRELRKRNRLLEQENEILRRAAAYFASREHNPNGRTRWSRTWPMMGSPSRSPAGCWGSPSRRSTSGKLTRSRRATGTTLI